MSTPHPDELATLIALPPAAREALARCEGPGWVVYRARERRGAPPPTWQASVEEGPQQLSRYIWPEKMWLPASEAAILALVPGCPSLNVYERRKWQAWTLDHATDWLPTARLAALRLLAAVS